MNARNPAPLDKAGSHLWLIKARLMHLESILERLKVRRVTPNYVVMLEHAYLDVRKVIEELMLLSVCAHDFASVEICNSLRKAWHAEKIVTKLEQINPRFYPESIEIHPSDEKGIAGIFAEATTDCLTKKEAIRFYNQCGDILHSTNKSVTPEMIEQRLVNAATFRDKVLNLLKCFEIDLSGKRLTVVGQLLFEDKARPPELFYATLTST